MKTKRTARTTRRTKKTAAQKVAPKTAKRKASPRRARKTAHYVVKATIGKQVGYFVTTNSAGPVIDTDASKARRMDHAGAVTVAQGVELCMRGRDVRGAVTVEHAPKA